MLTDNERQAIEEIIGGNSNTFREFYCCWDERVYYFFLSKTKDHLNAQDLTQQTFIKFWEYRSSISTAYTLEIQLFHKAKLIFIDWLRKEATRRKLLEAAVQFYKAGQGADAADNRSQRLENALEQLPQMRRKVVELSHIHGYKYKEIADELNISVKTVDNHIHQALRQLRKYLSLFIIFF